MRRPRRRVKVSAGYMDGWMDRSLVSLPATGGEATAAPPPPPTLTHSTIIPHPLPTSLSLCPASLWRPLAGTSLLVDGNSLIFWIADQAFDDHYTQWAGGYQRCVRACVPASVGVRGWMCWFDSIHAIVFSPP